MTGQSPQQLPTREGVLRAAEKIAAILPPTPLIEREIGGQRLWFKAECLQPIGAFKIRGAWHRLSDLDDAQRAAGVVAFSSGNHAQGIAWAARRLGISATIVMPTDAPRAKMQATRDLGAAVKTYDRMSESREEIGAALARERGAVLVPSFDDPWVVEGQGSAAIEAESQLRLQGARSISHIVTPCGGGGLAAGCTLALPNARVTIVEPEGWDDMGESLRKGRIVPVGPNPPVTSCDALQTLKVSPLTFDVLKDRGAASTFVTEGEIAAAMRYAMQSLGLVLEPGGSVALAAILAGKAAVDEGTVVLLSGRNVDPLAYAQVIGE